MEYVSEGAIDYGSNYQSACRSEQPSIGNEDAVLLQCTQHVTPTGHRLVPSKTKEGGCYFGGNISRNQQTRLGQEQAESFGQNLASPSREISSAKATCRQDTVPAPRADNPPSYHP